MATSYHQPEALSEKTMARKMSTASDGAENHSTARATRVFVPVGVEDQPQRWT